MLPDATERLRFREMSEDDLDAMARLLGDPTVMRFYPRPKTRDEALEWIRWNERNYADHGHGLWIIETDAGEFLGDCGLTLQPVDGEQVLEVGFHVLPGHQGLGYASEAATACLRFAQDVLGAAYVTAIINPDNTLSRRVAEKLGMALEQHTVVHGQPVVVYSRRLST
ncbi:MAG TPA: GNAT family N-acetyltransferase [Marmoricola sp.]